MYLSRGVIFRLETVATNTYFCSTTWRGCWKTKEMVSRLLMLGSCLAFVQLDGGNAFVVMPNPPQLAHEIVRGLLRCSIPVSVQKIQVLYMTSNSDDEPEDTVRVRIWRVLASSYGEELTLKQLGSMVGERRTGELRNHLQHVEKQSKTLKNKNTEWMERRGLSVLLKKRPDKLKIQLRKGKKNEVYIKLV